jgi:hypothetical protein
MNVKIDTLEKASITMFKYLKEIGIEYLDLEKDYYWNTENEQRYNPYEKPTDLNFGQLIDDMSEVEKIASGEMEPIGYSFIRLAALLRYLGEQELESRIQ